jgi:glycine dehydrogenase subunit 1
LNRDKAEYLKGELTKAGCTLPFNTPTFNEFTVQFPNGAETACKRLLKKKIVAGLPLGQYYPELADHALVCVTETSSKADMDALVKEVTS